MAKLNMKKIKDSIINVGVAGAVGGAGTSFIMEKLPASLNGKIKAGAAILVGAILPELSPKTKFLGGVGAGMAGVGGAALLKEFLPPVAGVDGIGDEGWTPTLNALPMDNDPDMNGVGNEDFPTDEDVNGTNDTVNGENPQF